MGKHRYRALMPLVTRVRVKQFVQRWGRRHCIQQQDNTHQHRGDDRLAALQGIARY